MHTSRPLWARWMDRLFGSRRGQVRDAKRASLRVTGGRPFGQSPSAGFGEEFREARRGMERRGRLFAWLALTWTLCGVGFVGFVCWCVYHVLKTKGLVP